MFDRDLDAGSIPTVAAFSLNGAAPSEVLLAGAVVTLTLSVALADGEAASVSYTPPEEGALQGVDGIAASPRSRRPIESTAPIPCSARGIGGEVDAAGGNADDHVQ